MIEFFSAAHNATSEMHVLASVAQKGKGCVLMSTFSVIKTWNLVILHREQ